MLAVNKSVTRNANWQPQKQMTLLDKKEIKTLDTSIGLSLCLEYGVQFSTPHCEKVRLQGRRPTNQWLGDPTYTERLESLAYIIWKNSQLRGDQKKCKNFNKVNLKFW